MAALNLLKVFRTPASIGMFRTSNKKFSVCSSLLSKDNAFHQPDATPEEIDLVEKRRRLRKALRAEYLRKVTDPYSTDTIVFDPAVQRYYSMHMTMTERFVPTFKNWCEYFFCIIFPIIVVAIYFKYDKRAEERKIRKGIIEYKDRRFKHQ